jgi:ribonuclease P protein component
VTDEKSAARFPRAARILAKHEFDQAFRAGLSAGSKLFRGLVVAGESARLGITVPKRAVPLASSRNRIKRIVREAFRLRRASLPPLHFVVVARGEIAAATRCSGPRRCRKAVRSARRVEAGARARHNRRPFSGCDRRALSQLPFAVKPP